MAVKTTPYSEAITRDNWVKHGERPSLMDYGAKGDVKTITVSTVASSAVVHAVFSAATGTIASAGVLVTGVGTSFLSQVQLGQYIQAGSSVAQVSEIVDDTHLLLAAPLIPHAAASAWSVGAGFDNTTDIGKRIVIYGAGPNTERVSFLAGATSGINSTDLMVTQQIIDCQGATTVKFAGNCSMAGVTWQVVGSNASDLSGGTIIYGPVALTTLAVSDFHTEPAPAFRYYGIQSQSTGTGTPGTFYGSSCAYGYIFGGNISTIQSPTQCTLIGPAGTTRGNCYAYFGTDDTIAIQKAFNTLAALVPPGTADGGIRLEAPRGKYLISAPIFQRPMVTLKGHTSGGTIFMLDGESFPASTASWNMTGTFATDFRIAFFTRLEDVRIDCGFIPGSIGVFCDALQEHSGLYRVTVINHNGKGVQAGSGTDQFGCANWVIQDLYTYPGITAFGDASIVGLDLDFCPDTLCIRGTVMGQGGFICGYGTAVRVRNGILRWYRLHSESAATGVHFDTGSGGILDGFDGQSFVQTAAQIDGGLPVTLRNHQSAGQNSFVDNIAGVIWPTGTTGFVPEYTSNSINNTPMLLGASVEMVASLSNPNVITWNAQNFSTDSQGGSFSVNSRARGFPNWVQTSTNASGNALFLLLSAQGMDVRQGPSVQPVFVATGIVNVSGTSVSLVSGTPFDVTWPSGTQIMLANSILAIISSVSSTSALSITSSFSFINIAYGVSTDPASLGGTQPGKSWFSAYQGIGIRTPAINFDVPGGVAGPLNFGNTLANPRARWYHGDAGQTHLILQRSDDGGSTWVNDITFDLAAGDLILPGGSGGLNTITPGISGGFSIEADFDNITLQAGVNDSNPRNVVLQMGSSTLYLKLIQDSDGNNLKVGNGITGTLLRLKDPGDLNITRWIGAGVASRTDPSNSFDCADAKTGNIGVGGAPDHTSTWPLQVYGKILSTSLTPSTPLRADSSKAIISQKVDLGLTSDVAGTGITPGQVLEWNGSHVAGVTGVSDTGGIFVSGVTDTFVTSIDFVHQTYTTASALIGINYNNHVWTNGIMTT